MASQLKKKLNIAREQICEAYTNGATLREIAELHGASIGTVRNLLKELGVDLRPRGRRQKSKNHPKVVAVEGAEAVPVTETYEGGAY